MDEAEKVNIENEDNSKDSENIESTESTESTNSDEAREEMLKKSSGINLEKLESEIRAGFRITEYNNTEYRIYLPTIKDDDILARYKSKLAVEVLKDKDAYLKEEVMKNLRQRGIWDDEKDKREKQLRDRYSHCLSDLFMEKAKDNPSNEIIDELRKEKISIDIDIAILTETKNYFINSAAESRIDEKVLMQKIALCIKDSEGKRLWNSVEELENYHDKSLVNSLTSEAIYFWAGIDPSMFDFTLG